MPDITEEVSIFVRTLEFIGTFAGAVSGVRLASVKRFDWFGASVIGFITAVGGGTLRDVLIGDVWVFSGQSTIKGTGS